MPTARDLASRWPTLQIAARVSRLRRSMHLVQGPLAAHAATLAAPATRAAEGLVQRDTTVWSRDAGVQAKVAQRLGWLDSPLLMADSLERLRSFADGVRRDGFTDAILLGMGGSSLAPEVLRAVLDTAPGGLRLHMLDSTDPAAVLAADTPLAHTLFLFASKSGTTIEPNSLAAHFQQALVKAGIDRWSRHFVAITDEGTELARRAQAEQFRDVFINPADIGGRYSALSFFGLVPSALMGQDVSALVGWGLAMLVCAEPSEGSDDWRGAAELGVAMAAGARSGRNKMTLLVPAALEPFGLWIEQLVAESTGKSGVGVVPVVGETPADAGHYGADRLFIDLRVEGTPGDAAADARIAALEQSGAPVARITMPELAALGAEFVRWEIATAIAGALLEINPFDEPNVSQAKDATRALLSSFQRAGKLPVPAPDRTTADGVTLTLSAAARVALERAATAGPEALLSLLAAGDYFALLAYVGPDPALASALETFRMVVRDRTRAATTFGYGPRYLHSSGQLHKGGPNTGVFVIVSANPHVDLPIPGESFTFGTLELAQALGDFQSLDATGRRALHVHLPSPDAALLARTLGTLQPRPVGS
jgi:transaldolase/glucose-6-phosphate isomerase